MLGREFRLWREMSMSFRKSPSQRIVQPELLDDLPPGHPDALRNRRDLRLIHWLQGNYRWIAQQVQAERRANEAILEPGAGQGDLAFYHARQGVVSPLSADWTGLDLWPRPEGWPEAWRWKQEDLLAFSRYADYPVFVLSFILHQFEDAALRQLGSMWQKSARVIIASETLRAPRARLGFKALWPLMNHISRHDGSVSIEGGFCGQELPERLGLCAPDWRVAVTESPLGTYRMVAVRADDVVCQSKPESA